MKKLSLSLLLLTASSAFAMQSKWSLLIGNVPDANTRNALNAIYDEMAQEISSLRKQLGLPIPYTKPSAATAAAPYYPPTAAALIPAASQPAKIVPTPIASASAASGAAAPAVSAGQPTGQISPKIQNIIKIINKMNLENYPLNPRDPANPTAFFFLEILKQFKNANENVAPAVQALKAKLKEIGETKFSVHRALYENWAMAHGFSLRGKESTKNNLEPYVKAGILTDQDVDDIYNSVSYPN